MPDGVKRLILITEDNTISIHTVHIIIQIAVIILLDMMNMQNDKYTGMPYF